MQKQKIAIVGGGLAGLSAAYELSKHTQYDVLLIEKNNYLGGRVHSLSIQNTPIDFGGFIIYPWYKQFHSLIKELALKNDLKRIPAFNSYLAFLPDHQLKSESEIDFTLFELITGLIKIFPAPLVDLDPTNPKLDAYKHLTIKEYVQSLKFDSETEKKYLNRLDTYLQGYCYGSIDTYKMSLMTATFLKNIFSGDIYKSFYFPKGTAVFAEKIGQAIIKNGGKIALNTEITEVDKTTLHTKKETIHADTIIFCQTISPELYKNILPDTPINWTYTNFIAATIEFTEEPMVNHDEEWGACFFQEDPVLKFPILSMIRLSKLYGENLNNHLTAYIKVNEENTESLLDHLKPQFAKYLHSSAQAKKIVESVHWKKTMPTTHEQFIKAVKENQNKNGYLFAGDFMGTPSMETALMNGKRAAEILINS